MKIDILNDDPVGSSSGVTPKTIWGDGSRIGVGGSELALLTMCEAWHKEGHDITLYNNPKEQIENSFKQRPIAEFNPTSGRDFLIIFRVPTPKVAPAKGVKVWWSCDQYTIGDYRHFASFVDKVVCISPFHADYFEKAYGIANTIVIDLPVRLDDFEGKDIQRIPSKLIFTSVPDRGLQNLWRMYPKIKKKIPELSLTITSDYRLWGATELNSQHRNKWIVYDDIEFFGALPRTRYIEELMRADILLYPGIYDELFCIAVAEAECLGVVPITSAKGALATTNVGHIFNLDCNDQRNDWAFIDRTVELLQNRAELDASRQIIQVWARERFGIERILDLWNKNVFGEK